MLCWFSTARVGEQGLRAGAGAAWDHPTKWGSCGGHRRILSKRSDQSYRHPWWVWPKSGMLSWGEGYSGAGSPIKKWWEQLRMDRRPPEDQAPHAKAQEDQGLSDALARLEEEVWKMTPRPLAGEPWDWKRGGRGSLGKDDRVHRALCFFLQWVVAEPLGSAWYSLGAGSTAVSPREHQRFNSVEFLSSGTRRGNLNWAALSQARVDQDLKPHSFHIIQVWTKLHHNRGVCQLTRSPQSPSSHSLSVPLGHLPCSEIVLFMFIICFPSGI